MKAVLTLLTLFCTVPLFALKSTTLTSNSTTTLENDTIYNIASAGTYTVTTGGVEINTRINVTTKDDITLILDRCHLITPDDLVSSGSPYYGAPIVITGKNPTITLQFKGENSLQCAPDMKTNRFAGAITLLPKDESRNISLSLEGIDDNASLTSHGRTFNNTKGSAYGPIYLPDDSTTGKTITTSVTLKRGKFHFISSDTTQAQAPMLTPAITATNITLDGATITTSIAPFNTTSNTGTSTWSDIIDHLQTQKLHPIFRCNTFTMKEGILKTAGRTPTLSEKINAYTTTPYDTTYAVPDALLTLPSFATTTYGTIYGQTFTTFYGLNTQGESNALKACFSPTGDVSLSSNALTINAAQAQPKFADNHLNPTTALAASNVFQLPLIATSQGFTMQPYTFGIRTITATKSQVSLEIALDLPNIDASLTTKAMSLRILCNGTIVFQSLTPHTFTRQTGTDTFITTVTVPYPFADNTQGTACYTVRAISE